MNANRLHVKTNGLVVEILPSKGLSIGNASYDGKPILWKNPSPLYDPDKIDLYSSEVAVNGTPKPGFVYIKLFTGGIEMLGPDNWGMPHFDLNKNSLHVLHGSVHSIPVEEIEVRDEGEEILVEGKVETRTFKGEGNKPWYKKGTRIFEVTKKIYIAKNKPQFRVQDSIQNISKQPQLPDWGYHITFYPENKSKYLVPSQKAFERFDGPVKKDFETWYPALDNQTRSEAGIIHQSLKKSKGALNGQDGYVSLLKYPDGTGISCTTPPVPYFQTWFCCGGAQSKEFTYQDGQPVLKNNWDGQGIEIGSSALDHNDKTDPSVPAEEKLAPGKTKTIDIIVKRLGKEETSSIEKEIRDCTTYREILNME
jgi:hypothetical protein